MSDENSVVGCVSGFPEDQGYPVAGRACSTLLPIHFPQLFEGDTEVFPDQLRDIISRACPRSARGLLQVEHARRFQGDDRCHRNKMLKPPQLLVLIHFNFISSFICITFKQDFSSCCASLPIF